MVTGTQEKRYFNKFYKGNPILQAYPVGGGLIRVIMVSAVSGATREQFSLTKNEWNENVEQREVPSRRVAYLRSLVRSN